MYIILRLFGLSCVFVGFGEGVCVQRMLAAEFEDDLAISLKRFVKGGTFAVL